MLRFPKVNLLYAPELKKNMPSGQISFFAQTGKENSRMRMKIVIYFVNDKK